MPARTTDLVFLVPVATFLTVVASALVLKTYSVGWLVGLPVSGIIAGVLASRRQGDARGVGLAAAAVYLVILVGVLIVALLTTDPSHFS